MDGIKSFGKAIAEYTQKIPSPVDDYMKEMKELNDDLLLMNTTYIKSKAEILNSIPPRYDCVMQGWSGRVISMKLFFYQLI